MNPPPRWDLSAFEADFLGSLTSNVRNEPSRVYHYTTIPSGHAILDSGELWCTDVRFLNDEREWEYAVQRTLDRLADARDLPSDLRTTLELEAHALEYRETFVACFSEDGDALSQWRGYGGRGCALGYSPTHLRTIAAQVQPSGVFLPVIYHVADQDHLIDGALEALSKKFVESKRDDVDLVFLGQVFSALLSTYAPVLKDPAFVEEQEWRIIIRHSPDTRAPARKPAFRVADRLLIPFVAIPLSDDSGPVVPESIVIAPGPHADLAALGWLRYTTALGMSSAVERSKVPFRDWQ